MIVLDAGHSYLLRNLDTSEGFLPEQPLVFVKREGDGYPGNVGIQPGTTTQEVLRALIDRAEYVDNQIPDSANRSVILKLRQCIWLLEERAARRHGRPFPLMTSEELEGIEDLPTCPKCNHVGCEGECHD
jgi:hypothetical protein